MNLNKIIIKTRIIKILIIKIIIKFSHPILISTIIYCPNQVKLPIEVV